ncbi:MAG: hypothetical protein HDR88_10465 [Bacteroides sp.]|nr:hypothetical protein [Bacteroides sp.]
MTPIQEATYNIVKELQDKRMAEHREPVNVSLLDIQRAMNELVKLALNGLVENGTMTWFNSLNGIPMFKIQKPIQ